MVRVTDRARNELKCVSLLFDLTEHGLLLLKGRVGVGGEVLLHSESDVGFEQSVVFTV